MTTKDKLLKETGWMIDNCGRFEGERYKSRKKAIASILGAGVWKPYWTIWRHWEDTGYRCVKVVIQEIQRKGSK